MRMTSEKRAANKCGGRREKAQWRVESCCRRSRTSCVGLSGGCGSLRSPSLVLVWRDHVKLKGRDLAIWKDVGKVGGWEMCLLDVVGKETGCICPLPVQIHFI